MFTAPPELLTGLTDFLNCVISLAFCLWLRRFSSPAARPWRLAIGTLTVSNLIGGIVHTVAFPEIVDTVVWFVLTLILCAAVAMFCVCAAQERRDDLRGPAYRVFSILGAVFYAAIMISSFFYEDYIKIYVAYAAIFLIWAMVSFIHTAIKQKRYGLLLYAVGLFVQFPGGIVQAKRTLHFTLIWEIDYNTVYHFCLTVTMIILWIAYARMHKKETVA